MLREDSVGLSRIACTLSRTAGPSASTGICAGAAAKGERLVGVALGGAARWWAGGAPAAAASPTGPVSSQRRRIGPPRRRGRGTPSHAVNTSGARGGGVERKVVVERPKA